MLRAPRPALRAADRRPHRSPHPPAPARCGRGRGRRRGCSHPWIRAGRAGFLWALTPAAAGLGRGCSGCSQPCRCFNRSLGTSFHRCSQQCRQCASWRVISLPLLLTDAANSVGSVRGGAPTPGAGPSLRRRLQSASFSRTSPLAPSPPPAPVRFILPDIPAHPSRMSRRTRFPSTASRPTLTPCIH